MKHLEIQSFKHKDVDVVVKINYDTKEISLVEGQRNNPGVYEKKSWIFSNRGLEYMQGWLNILDAMAYAVKEAEKLLKAHTKALEEEHARLIMMLQKEDLKVNKKK